MSQGILLEAGTNEMELLVFSVGTTAYGVNVAKVRELIQQVRTVTVPYAPYAVEGSFQRREEVLTLVNLAKYLEVEPDLAAERLIVILELNNCRCGVLVDRVEMIHRLRWEQIEPPSQFFSDMSTPITAVARIGGRVILILDFERIIGDLLGIGVVGADDVAPRGDLPKERKDIRILVADDSMTVLDTLANVLGKWGFEHIVFCRDGQDAWDQVSSHIVDGEAPFDVVLTDIEMPRMDGLHLTARIKNDPVLRAMKVILFSSIISDDTANKGLSVGADMQIAKSDSKRLLEALDQLVVAV